MEVDTSLMDLVVGCVQPRPLSNVNSHICQICGDDVGVTLEGEMFVACTECGFPVCRPCYEYERKDGTQACPQCRTRYRRHKGVLSMASTCYRGFRGCGVAVRLEFLELDSAALWLR